MLKTSEKLGELLIKSGLVTKEQLAKALEVQRGTSKRVGEVLTELGLVSELDIAKTLSAQLGIKFATQASGLLNPLKKSDGLEQLVPEEFARQHLVLPISKSMHALTVACVDPLDLLTLDNLSRMSRCEINPIVTTKADLDQAIERFYGHDSMLKEAIGQSYELASEQPVVSADEELNLDRLRQAAEDAPIIKLVDLMIRQAIKERASDIHVEPYKNHLNIRYRIDGVLCDIAPPAKASHLAITSRIKILSKMDIAEKRLPQDGGFSMTMENRSIDFRVSTIPTIYGEKVVLRILDKPESLVDLTKLGFDARGLHAFRNVLQDPYGLILITGPTGSGKSTTLYAALKEVRTGKKNILTVEDPVEYRLDGVNQVQVHPSIGLTFAAGLRAFMRQDPDIIMVGEIRDLETAEICVRASLTGHLVFSTLHTNDAPSAINRLIDIGVAPYLLSSTISLIVAQRLLRRLCEHCKEAYEPIQEVRERFHLTEELLYRAKGCEQCMNIGYRGRLGIYEIMTLSRDLRELIAKGPSAHVLKDIAVANGMSSLWQEGLKKVQAGLTSLEELEAVVLLDR